MIEGLLAAKLISDINIGAAVSEGVLALVALGCAVALSARWTTLPPHHRQSNVVARIGILLVGVAATVAFFMFVFDPGLKPLHAFLSKISRYLSLPLMGATWVAVAWSLGPNLKAWLSLIGALVLFAWFSEPRGLGHLCELLFGVAGVLGILLGALKLRSSHPTQSIQAALSALIVLVAALWARETAQLWLSRADVFHYALAAAILLQTRALLSVTRLNHS